MQAGQYNEQERRAGSHGLIKRLVDARKAMLTLYSELAAKKPLQADPEVPGLLQDFCQTLIDYTANAHFQLYRFIAEKTERRQSVISVADQIYPHIEGTIEVILDFNDKYDCGSNCSLLEGLETDLSLLGERLADRIELEDKLINLLCSPRH